VEVGLDYFNARYFSAAEGRFNSPDLPFAGQDRSNPQSWNLYSYTLNNPLRYIDPTGHEPEEGTCGKDRRACEARIGPLPETRNGQTTDRALGAIKGLANDFLDIAEFLGAPEANTDQIKGGLGLYPKSQNEKFGGDVARIASTLFSIASLEAIATLPKISQIFAKEAASAERLVIGRGADLTKSGALGPGEFKLNWPPTGSVQAEYKNEFRLVAPRDA
jgi:RHS repeat-associated protein